MKLRLEGQGDDQTSEDDKKSKEERENEVASLQKVTGLLRDKVSSLSSKVSVLVITGFHLRNL